jgi:hypothetical protein
MHVLCRTFAAGDPHVRATTALTGATMRDDYVKSLLMASVAREYWFRCLLQLPHNHAPILSVFFRPEKCNACELQRLLYDDWGKAVCV